MHVGSGSWHRSTPNGATPPISGKGLLGYNSNMNFVQVSLQKRGAAAIDAFEISQSLCAKQFAHTVVLSDENELKTLWSENGFRRIVWVKTYKSSLWSFVVS